MSLYERYKVLPIQKTDMPDLPMKPKPAPSSPASKKRETSTARIVAKKTDASTKKPLARGKKDQPRDSRGRWVKVGAALWSGTKATVKGVGRAVKGTAKAVKSVHRTVKRVQSTARKKDALRHRERNIALAEKEYKLGLRKRKVRRTAKRRTR